MKWMEVLDFLENELPRRHKNLFFSIGATEYLDSIRVLKGELNSMENLHIQTEIGKIVASVQDAHTSIEFPVYSLCPLEFYWFSDGIYAVNTSKSDEALRFKKIIKIDGTAMETVIEKLSTIISHENQFHLKALLPHYLPAVEFLYGLQIASSLKGLTFTCQNESGEQGEWFVPSYPFYHCQKLLSENRISFQQDKLPLFRQKQNLYYWMDYLENSKTLYFKYNICKEMDDEPVAAFGERFLQSVRNHKPEKIVIDMRNNTGGNSTLLDPFIAALSKCGHINREGKLFIIIGRDTFSSALLNVYSLKNRMPALLVGEPTGGKPNSYGEVVRVKLEHSGFVVNYSTQYYKLIQDDLMPSLFPDVYKEYSIQDYIRLADPCMDFILLP